MFEEKNTVNNYEITRNQKQNSSNKLKGYFQNSSFLAQQQQLAIFIKNLPIIKIDDVKSINKLIEILIRQNEMIGNKCQQNFITIRQCYTKHDDLLKRIRNLQRELSEAKRDFQIKEVNNKQIESYLEQMQKLKNTLRQKQKQYQKIIDEYDQTKLQSKYYNEITLYLGETINQISQKNYKRVLQKLKQMNKKSKEQQMTWINWNELQAYIKQQKKRIKYSQKIKQTVQIFCNRFLKIIEYMSINNIKDQFSKEIINLMQILDELLLIKKKNSNISSQSRLSYNGNNELIFFEGLLGKIIKDQENDCIIKQNMVNQLSQVKQQLNESKKYYEQCILKMKLQYESVVRQSTINLQQKQHILKFYEEQKQKYTKQIIEMKNKIIQLQQTLHAQRNRIKIKQQQYQILQNKLELIKNQFINKQNQIIQKWQENSKTYQYKLNQKIQLIQQEQKLRKLLRIQLDQTSNTYKNKLAQLQQSITQITHQNKRLENQNLKLTQQNQKIIKKLTQQKQYLQKQLIQKATRCQQVTRRVQKDLTQIRTLQNEAQQCQRQKNLQQEYIRQLQSKSTQLLMKIKSLESKKSDEKTAKKQMNVIKQTILQQKKISRQIQQNYTNQRQQNQRLKNIIKQMKKQLQSVYIQFNNLKMIQVDRQKLILQIQKSDRLKQQIIKQYQIMKIDLIKYQQQNKSLLIQIKYYKNALMRIQALKQI